MNLLTLSVIVLSIMFGGHEFRVVQQDCPVCVSGIDDVFTQFDAATKRGAIGLLAHDYLAGRYLNLQIGDTVTVAYSDRIETFEIVRVEKWLALNPNYPHGYFRNTEILSASELFDRVYSGFTIQTCDRNYRVFFIGMIKYRKKITMRTHGNLQPNHL